MSEAETKQATADPKINSDDIKQSQQKDDLNHMEQARKKFQNSFLATSVNLNASMAIQRKKMMEQYNSYSKAQSRKYLTHFKKDDFYKEVTNSLLAYDFQFKPEKHIKNIVCDKFLDGAFSPDKDNNGLDSQIFLCSNVLIRKDQYEDAFKRKLIQLYDFQRSENYDFDNCKHLACTEVRAALFSSQCSVRHRRALTKMSHGKPNQDMLDANDFCVKDLAIGHLMERDKCAEKSERFVDYVFERCRQDTAPFAGGSQKKVKAMVDLL